MRCSKLLKFSSRCDGQRQLFYPDAKIFILPLLSSANVLILTRFSPADVIILIAFPAAVDVPRLAFSCRNAHPDTIQLKLPP